MPGFSFSFSGDDIEDNAHQAAETGSLQRRAPTSTAAATAFPITGQAQLPAQAHDLSSLLSTLPSKIAYSTLNVTLDRGGEMLIPRRELWDVRVQLMAEEDDEGLKNLAKDDVKTGVYEGGFKSWESSVDLVRVLGGRRGTGSEEEEEEGRWVLELGCGTALPTLALLQWHLQDFHQHQAQSQNQNQTPKPLNLGFADYNPDVLRLVTLPNILLSWAQTSSSFAEAGTEATPWETEGELELTPDLINAFLSSLASTNLSLSFYSGAWSPSFVSLITSSPQTQNKSLTILGAETIYSPAALQAFTQTMMAILRTAHGRAAALVGAKMVYFGVGGSVEDFCDLVRELGGTERKIREEADGVRRAVVEIGLGFE